MARESYDVIVIGSGFGGAMAAHVFVHAGLRVLMLERGGWLERGPHNWTRSGVIDYSPAFSEEAGYAVRGERRGKQRALFCVGGPSVYYGGVSLRLRERDFDPNPSLAGDSGGRWPYGYDELEPYYARAERILGVAGASGAAAGWSTDGDPTKPRRSEPYPHELLAISNASDRIGRAAASLGLRPFRLPLAINHAATNGRRACIGCMTCDAFPCAIGAKNDLATTVLPALVARGLRLEPDTVAVRLVELGGRVTSVECIGRSSRRPRVYTADHIVVSSGALGSAHLLLASALPARNPAGDAVGRYLMRHCNAIVYGVFPSSPIGDEFHKEIGIHDYYFGDPRAVEPEGKYGSIQQVHAPPLGIVLDRTPRPLHQAVPWLLDRMTGMLVIAEDQPRRDNRVALDGARRDTFGMPRLIIHHRYSSRDRAARRALARVARQVLREAGARAFYVHKILTFSHALGTVRMGDDPRTAPLDHACRFRGIDNLSVIDGSALPASGALNPSLTIAANALRAADLMVSGE